MIEPVKVATRLPKVKITPTLRSMRVGDTYRFPAGTNHASIRPLANQLGIRVTINTLDTGEIEVTRRL